MPATESRSRSISSESGCSVSADTESPDTEACLLMECEEEGLSEAQTSYYQVKKKAFRESMLRLGEVARSQMPVTSTSTMPPVPGQPSVPGAGAQYRLVVDNKTGRIIGSIPGNQSALAEVGAQVRGQTSRGRPASNVVLARKLATPTKPAQVVDLITRPAPGGSGDATRKAFPALTVTARPEKTLPPSQAKRPELDAKVKKLLQLTPAKFTEWLIQQGLVRSEQFEAGVKLKLGMYSDGKKFPHSGGYVWIQEGQSSKYTSVFRGSIFESSTNSQSPTIILKLLYHWSCQTNLTNIINWVKVDNKKIDDFFNLIRSVCVTAVQDEVTGLGKLKGGSTVEVGVISLGTTTADGQRREVRVEVLGVLDRVTKQIRLRATEPIAGATQQERFTKIFEMLPTWVDTNAAIVTDFSVDKETLTSMGYTNVTQCSLSVMSARKNNSNSQIMDYLKKVVPKMFQNTLSNLSIPVIQQFLDELTFRELFGNHPLGCFNNIIQRISNLTSALATNETTMISRLAEVSNDPFLDWRFSEISLGVSRGTKNKSPSPPPNRGKRSTTELLTKTSAKKSKTSKQKHDLVSNVGPGGSSIETVTKEDPEIPGVTKDDAFIAQNLVDTAIYDSLGDACCECGRSMTSSGHFLAYLCCTKCRFSTCCSRAMSKHHEQFHSEAKEFSMNKPTLTNELMFCVCGFSSNSGNKMAGHLARSGCSSAYPSLEEAGRAKLGGDTDNCLEAAVNNDEHGITETEEIKDDVSVEVSEERNKIEENNESEKVYSLGKEEEETSQQKESPEPEKSRTEEQSKDGDEQAPASGGILFGTFFNYMNQKEEESGKE